MKEFRITALAENITYRHNCLAQHGQSLLVETDGYKFLFDVGEVPGAIEHNMEGLGVGLDEIDDIVISHRHIDHIGALLPMMPRLSGQRLFLPMQLGEPHIKKHPEKYKFLKPNPDGGYDMAISSKDALKINRYERVELVGENGFELAEGIFTTGCVGDWMMEQAVVIDQGELGLSVLLGCSHPTVEVLIKKAIEVTGNKRVRMVLGGMHYTDFSEEEMREGARRIDNLGVEKVVPSHCTTVRGGEALREVLGDKVLLSKTGTFGAGNSVVLGERVEPVFV